MHIYILTYKRDIVETFKYIPFDWLQRTTVVVQERDKDRLVALPCRKLVLPDSVRDIGATRQWVIDNATDDKIMQLDDDLTISVLREPGKYYLRDADHKDMRAIFARVSRLLDRYPHVGAAARNEAHLCFDKDIKTCGRAIRFHGFNVPKMRDLRINIDRVPTIEDYDFILQILKKGVENAIDCQVFVGDKGSNLPGGCSEIRAASEDGKWARLLQKHHPQFVTLVEKTTKMPGGKLWTRTDVRVAWKKAYEYGLKLHNINDWDLV